jgi:tellurite resistance protein TerC
MLTFPFTDYWTFYLLFTAGIILLLILDLGVFHRKAHEVSVREASLWTIFWISIALVFNICFYYYCLNKFSLPEYAHLFETPSDGAKTYALEFLTGYIVEKSLAIDNIFIFAVVFSYFKIPQKYQHRVLFWGIIGALIFRAIFISLGSVLMQYNAIVIFFGILLILTGIKMFVLSSEDNSDLSNNIIIRLLNKIFRVYPKIESQNLFIRIDKILYVTPLFIALCFIELTDIIFSIDSVPAIFALTKEPFIVFTSNIFAIIGLRSMYFMLVGVLDKFMYIKYGLAAVLIFVGLKMVVLNDYFGGKFPISWSLIIISSLIGISILASIIKMRLGTKDSH